MSDWLYPEAVQRVEKACTFFLLGQLNVEDLQTALYQSEQEIEAFEEKWLRSLLFEAENKLEEIIYMVSSGQQKEVMVAIVHKLLSDIHNRKDHPPAA